MCRPQPACTWFLEIAFVHDVGVCVCVCVPTPEATDYIDLMFSLYIKLGKFATFQNVTMLFY